MKKLTIPYIEKLDKLAIADAGEVLMTEAGRNDIGELNWPEQFDHKPETRFYIARSAEAVIIHYIVTGKNIKAVYAEDQSHVHEDSCVEFFCKPEWSDSYTNFEFNCIGTCSASSRKGRDKEILPFSSKEMLSIERHTSILREVFSEKHGDFEWSVTVKIPLQLMGLDPDNLPEKIRGNFYKCADDTAYPHFVSWSPIETEQPDFHRPEFFGELFFI